MARFRCCDCNNTFSYSGKHECPNCRSRNVQFAVFGDRVMALSEPDITPGYYWVRNRKNGELSIVRVAIFELLPDCPTTAVEHHGWEVADEIETAMREHEFLAHIETPDFPS